MATRSYTKEEEEFLKQLENDLIELMSMSIELPDLNTTLSFDKENGIVPLKLHFVLPEYSIYVLTIKYKLKQRSMKGFEYKQVVRRAGIPFQTRVCPIEDAEFENPDKVHAATFGSDDLPGGMVVRATYKCTSSILEEGNSILDVPWLLEIAKKDATPRAVVQ